MYLLLPYVPSWPEVVGTLKTKTFLHTLGVVGGLEVVGCRVVLFWGVVQIVVSPSINAG